MESANAATLNELGAASPVIFETVNLCGFDVPVFRGAQPIPQDAIDALKRPLPADAITPNTDPKKRNMSSIRSIYIVERLNEVFGLGQWFQSAKFVEKVAKPEGSGKGDSVVLKSILVIPKYGIYFEAYGGNDNYDPGDAYKGACTDALTKMAGFMYVGMDVFKGHPETSNQATQSAAKNTRPTPKPATQPEQAKAVTPAVEQPKVPKCADCSGEIKGVKIGETDYTAESVATAGRRNFNLDLCAECQKKRRTFATMPAHSDQTPGAIKDSRPINATEKRAFWSAAKVGHKTEQDVGAYFATLGIKTTAEMKKAQFDSAMKWAVQS
jgi:ribosomal protein L34E